MESDSCPAHLNMLQAENMNFLQDEKVIKEKRVMTLKGRCKQQKHALDAAKLDIQRLKKTIKTLEVRSCPSNCLSTYLGL